MTFVPDLFAEHVAACAGEKGQAWLDGLPDLAADYAQRWQLSFDGPVGNEDFEDVGFHAVQEIAPWAVR